MNQAIKERVYGLGNKQQLEYMAELAGMLPEEKAAFMLFHEKKNDDIIEDALGLTRSSRELIESSIASKLMLAVFQCINYHMDHYSE